VRIRFRHAASRQRPGRAITTIRPAGRIQVARKRYMTGMAERIYLDWNATTPLRPEAQAAMAHALASGGNPSSVHADGRQDRRLVEEARATVAAAVGAEAQNAIFTSG